MIWMTQLMARHGEPRADQLVVNGLMTRIPKDTPVDPHHVAIGQHLHKVNERPAPRLDNQKLVKIQRHGPIGGSIFLHPATKLVSPYLMPALGRSVVEISNGSNVLQTRERLMSQVIAIVLENDDVREANFQMMRDPFKKIGRFILGGCNQQGPHDLTPNLFAPRILGKTHLLLKVCLYHIHDQAFFSPKLGCTNRLGRHAPLLPRVTYPVGSGRLSEFVSSAVARPPFPPHRVFQIPALARKVITAWVTDYNST